jgi:hypothetical protein
VFNFSIISPYDFSLIDKAAFQATLSEWAFVRVSAVAFLIGYGPGCCISEVFVAFVVLERIRWLCLERALFTFSMQE